MRVCAVGLWMPQVADARLWLTGMHSSAAGLPKAALLAPMARRRLSIRACAMADAFGQITDRADRAEVATVFASAWGDAAVTAELLDQLAGDGELSPLRFAGAAHHAAGDEIRAACGNGAFTTCLAAGNDTVAMALLEARALLQSGISQVAVVMADSPPPTALADLPGQTLAVALLLDAKPPDHSELARLANLGDHRELNEGDRAPAGVQLNPLAGALSLADAVLRQMAVRVALAPVGHRGWAVDVLPSQRPLGQAA